MLEETQVEKLLMNEVQRLGGKALKFTSPGMNGVPDRIVLLPGGQVVFAELKAKKGILSRMQKHRIKQLNSLGFKVVILNSKEQIEEFIKGVS